MSPERKEIMQMLRGYFGDSMKGRIQALIWYGANNPLLGGCSPKHMVQAGRTERLKDFIREQLDSNDAPPARGRGDE